LIRRARVFATFVVRLRPRRHNVAAALASPVAFLTDANCDADRGFFASATTCNAGSRSLAMAFRAQRFVGMFGTYLRCNTSGSLAMLAAIRRASSRVSSSAAEHR
jgi:hypothetical protein